MADLNIEGLAIAPGVLETIVSLAACDVAGVAAVGDLATSTIRTFIGGKPSTQGVDVSVNEDSELEVAIRVSVKSGYVLQMLRPACAKPSRMRLTPRWEPR